MTTTPGKSLLTTVFTLLAFCIGMAADSTTAGSDASASQTPAKPATVLTAAPGIAQVKLPYGVEDVLKLSRAQIGEDIIVNYVQNSGTIYNLEPKDIVYLRDQGVSEKVIGTMLNQRARVEQATAQSAAVQAAQVQSGQLAASAPAPTDANGEQPGYYTDSNGAYATAPLTPPASTAYVIANPAVSSAYYGYYYPYYYGPSVSFVFGAGGYGYYGGHCYYGGHGSRGHGYYGGHGSFGHGGHH